MNLDRKFWISFGIKLFSAILIEYLFEWYPWGSSSEVEPELETDVIEIIENMTNIVAGSGHQEL